MPLPKSIGLERKMLEYFVFDALGYKSNLLTENLNEFARKGWRFVGSVANMVILEREVSPRIEESKTEKERIVSYAFPL
jgi:hypothetical protein